MPVVDLIVPRLGHRGQQIQRNLQAVQLVDVHLNLPRAQARVQRDDLLLKARNASLVLLDQLRLEVAVAAARR